VNKKVVKELKAEFEGKVFARVLYILTWKMEDLKAYRAENLASKLFLLLYR